MQNVIYAEMTGEWNNEQRKDAVVSYKVLKSQGSEIPGGRVAQFLIMIVLHNRLLRRFPFMPDR